MDPRHPEEAIDRIDQLITQFKYTLDNMRTAAVSSQLAKFEREGGLVVQEICLVAPRLHEAMMQVSRQRRHDLSHGVTLPEVPAELLKEPTLEAVENYIDKAVGYLKQAEYVGEPHFEISEKGAKELLETYVEPNQTETVIVEPKPRKKKTTKKKKAE